MFYREAGDFKTSYAEDNQTFPIAFDRYRYYFVLIVAFAVVPFVINDYWANAILLPFLIYAIAAIGLNILTGYCGQVSLGTGGFMAVGAYAVLQADDGVSLDGHGDDHVLSGVITAMVGVLFGLPSLRIKGFYLAVATLAAQFFLVWLFNKVPWFYNYSASGQISAPERFLFGVRRSPGRTPRPGPPTCSACLRAGLDRAEPDARVGRAEWMAIRDMDIAAEIIGVNPLKAKLTAFAVSSFYVGIAGALFFHRLSSARSRWARSYGIQKSFLMLFMIIIGGLGSIFGSFAGAAFMVLCRSR
jgi:branched-chain amino acid transport system permease protein